jgi:hypothetical protein
VRSTSPFNVPEGGQGLGELQASVTELAVLAASSLPMALVLVTYGAMERRSSQQIEECFLSN